MKGLFCSLSALFVSLSLNAQQLDNTVTIDNGASMKKNEVGILIHTDIRNNNNTMMLGAQYKYYKNDKTGMRFMGGFSPYNHSTSQTITGILAPNTVKKESELKSANMLFLGFGLEKQRHFYKSLHFFAALDLYGGIGTGEYQKHYVAETVWDPNVQRETRELLSVDINNYTRSFIRILPSIGAKFVFKKLNFGTEFSCADLGIYSEKVHQKYANTTVDMNLFNASSVRLFLNYRF